MSEQRLINCPICAQLIGECDQSIAVSYGFGDHMPVLHTLLFHRECTEGLDVVNYMKDYFEMELD